MARRKRTGEFGRTPRLVAAGAAGWLAWSWRLWNRPVPPEEEARSYARELMERLGLGDLYGSWEEEEIQGPAGKLQLYHFKGGTGDPAVVFVPGTSVYALLYVEFMHRLSQEGFNVVGFDPRGHGMSEGKRGVYTLGQLVEDALAVVYHCMASYGSPVAIGGSSQGGMVAFYCAAAEPALAAAVCHNLLAPDEPDNERMTRNPSLFRLLMPFLPYFGPLMRTTLGELMIPVSLYLDLEKETSRLIPDVVHFLKNDPLAVNWVSLSALHSLASTPLARPVEEIEVPVMVIHAGKDNIFPEDYVRRVFNRLRCEKEFLYLPDYPHLVVTDYPEVLAPAVGDWLKKVIS
jgi:pimeloyl-ACP methyl ester carboxylesterase